MRFGILVFFFFKQKTAYEVRISDWSSDVCSSDLDAIPAKGAAGARRHFVVRAQAVWAIMAEEGLIAPLAEGQAPDGRSAFLVWNGWDQERDAEEQPVRAAGERFGIRERKSAGEGHRESVTLNLGRRQRLTKKK